MICSVRALTKTADSESLCACAGGGSAAALALLRCVAGSIAVHGSGTGVVGEAEGENTGNQQKTGHWLN